MIQHAHFFYGWNNLRFSCPFQLCCVTEINRSSLRLCNENLHVLILLLQLSPENQKTLFDTVNTYAGGLMENKSAKYYPDRENLTRLGYSTVTCC